MKDPRPARPGPTPPPTPSGSVQEQPQAPARGLLLEEEIHLFSLVNVLLEHWRIMVGLPLLTAIVAALHSLTLQPTFTAAATFVTESSSRSSIPPALAGLAGQFGVGMETDLSKSPQFYVELAKSRRILESVLLVRYVDSLGGQNRGDSATLLDIFNVQGPDVATRLKKGVGTLRNLVFIAVDNPTNIVSLTVEAPYPTLAADLANTFVEHLNDFNETARQSRVRARRRFVEERVGDSERELRNAEDELGSFYERNRSWQQSPQLRFEEGRWGRQVDIRQEVYSTLQREYEMARIEEVNETPVITVIDAAVSPLEPSGPNRPRRVMVALVLGWIMSTLWAFGAEYLDHVRRAEERAYLEFRDRVRRLQDRVGKTVHRVVPW